MFTSSQGSRRLWAFPLRSDF